MDSPWKVIAAFLGVFAAGAVFGGMVALRTRAPLAPAPAVSAPASALSTLPVTEHARPQVAGPQANASPQLPKASSITPALMRQLTMRLKLSTEQREKIRPVVAQASEGLQRLRQENLAETARLSDQMYADVAALLTDEQRRELELMRTQMQERVQAERKRRAEALAAETAARTPAPSKEKKVTAP